VRQPETVTEDFSSVPRDRPLCSELLGSTVDPTDEFTVRHGGSGGALWRTSTISGSFSSVAFSCSGFVVQVCKHWLAA
jgi:hypothetical protein